MGGLVSGLFGSGSSFQAATTSPDLQAAQQRTGMSNDQQQAMLAQLAAQNGISNQSGVFAQQQALNAQLAGMNGAGTLGGAAGQQAGLNSQLAGAGGLQGQQAALAGSLGLAGQLQPGAANLQGAISGLQGVANGTGPNPAAAQLANATAANTANQAALMAGQRGAGANAGLLARQIAQQGAANQQNAIGQMAALQAQQQLGALGQIGSLAGTQVGAQQSALGQAGNLGSGLTSQQMQGIGQQANIGQAQLGAQQTGINTAGNIANQQVGNQLNTQQQIAQNALTNQQIAAGQLQSQNNINAQMAQQQAQQQSGLVGGLLGGAASALTGGLLSGGGTAAMGATSPGTAAGFGSLTTKSNPNAGVGNYAALAHGGKVESQSTISLDHGHGPKSYLAKTLKGGLEAHPIMMASGGEVPKKVPAMVSPGEQYIPPQEVKQVASGQKDPLDAGMKIPGKAKVKGDSLKNDTVPATLEEGGIVIPKSVMESKNPHWEAKRFVEAIMAKQGLKK